MKTCIPLILFFSFFSSTVLSQNQTVFKGKIQHEHSGTPVEGAAVSIIGLSEGGKTNSNGNFSIDLGRFYESGKPVRLLIHHKDYGSHMKIVILPLSGSFMQEPIKITRSNNLIIAGQVINASDKSFIKDIEVGVSSMYLNDHINPVKTNRLGQFKIEIPKIQLRKDFNYIELQVRDPNKVYKDLNEIKSIHSAVEIEIEKRPFEKSIKVNSYMELRIPTQKDDLITIEANGNITVGTFVGSLSPEGKSSGVLGFSLAGYNIVRQFNHGALMYRLNPRDPWQFCGGKCNFKSPRNGTLSLAFEVNDNKKIDNYGEFDVTIKVE